MHNFLREATEPTIGPSLGEQLMKGMHQVVIERLPLCKRNIEACEPDEARQAAMKVGRETLKRS